ncbi:hybrid sensor histidine kinase/response regulator [Porticoccus hydrocarbonoclasticus]|uniref:hybrid sensor histidine kinase/response regulator n=1 Tax=Porticoccus hydrocarbonoclasticus TaxID=1073414 RepID=UPI0030EE43D3
MDSVSPVVVPVESDVAESRDLPALEIVPLDREKIDLEILEIFIEEANELLEDIDRCLQDWQQDWQSREAVESLKRSLHTLKGGARMAGLQQLGELSHDFETDILDVEHQRDQLDEGMFSRWLHKQDQLQSALVAAKVLLGNDSEGAPPAEPVVELVEKTVVVGESPGISQIPAQLRASLTEIPGITPPQRPAAASTEMVKVSAPLLESLVNLAGETSISRGRVEREISDFSVTLDEMGSTITRLRDQVRRIGVETEAHMMFRQEQMEAMQPPEGFDSLEMDRYSQLQQLSQALLESAYDIQDLKETLADKARSAEGQLLIQSRINTDLQERLMRTRMVPFSRIVPRLRRMVRQVSDEVGKKVELQLINIDGEMDRSVMEQMLAPLEHMIRNSIDHGIESAADRLAAGKPETGVISVGLAREAGDILLLLSDDGRGLNVEAIRHRAIEQGLIPEDSPLDDQDVIEFIFQPGFSTSNKVTQVSGRGVGMDVVNSQVRELGGSVQVVTDPGKGTRFIVRLPFTVSVNRALMIEMGNDLYALSLSSVDGVVRVSPVELEYYYLYPEARLEYAGEYYEVLYLDSLLHHRSTPKLDMESQSVFLILVHTETRHFAIQVDGLAGSMEIVVKSLGIQLSKVPGLTGATVMGDGRVVVILDLLALLRSRLMTTSVADSEEIGEPETSSPVATVMVVDDSVTVRKVTSRFLLREGFSVITARDGLEAMTLLQEHRPDLMLLDIEMPRMDGFEVARRVKGSSELKQIPIIMITSRSGKKHRERAFSLGVEHYMGKPYQEQELLKAMAALMPVATESGE